MAFSFPPHTSKFLYGALAGAVVVAWAGFDAMGWKTKAATESIAARQAEQAVVASLAKICSAQFSAAKNAPARLAELQKVDRYSRGDEIAKAGYATMIGETMPTTGVAQACADLLLPEKPL